MALKEKALRRLAEKLNAAGVTWGMGASWLLCQRGILEGYHNFDVMVMESDIDRADRVLTRLGMGGREESGDAYHGTYHFDGADFDVMAGVILHTPEGEWHWVFDESAVAGYAEVQGAQVPLMHLEDWYVFYSLIGKEARADAIAQWWGRHGVEHPERFRRVTREPLPRALEEKINLLLKTEEPS